MTYDHLMILGFLVGSEYLGVLSVSTRMAESLKTGDMVERHMRDGDIVLFNRQPHLAIGGRTAVLAWKMDSGDQPLESATSVEFEPR